MSSFYLPASHPLSPVNMLHYSVQTATGYKLIVRCMCWLVSYMQCYISLTVPRSALVPGVKVGSVMDLFALVSQSGGSYTHLNLQQPKIHLLNLLNYLHSTTSWCLKFSARKRLHKLKERLTSFVPFVGFVIYFRQKSKVYISCKEKVEFKNRTKT